MSQGRAKVFLNYHEKDIEEARLIYEMLKYYPLLDVWSKIDLLPGEHTEIEPEKQVEKSDFFIALFSSHYNEGQDNFNLYLTYAKEKSKRIGGSVFIIPVKLEECKISHDLRKLTTLELIVKDKKNRKDVYENGVSEIFDVIYKSSSKKFRIKATITLNREDYEGKNEKEIKEYSKSRHEMYLKYLDGSGEILTAEEYFIAGLYSFACDDFGEALKRFYESLLSNLPEIIHPDIYSKIGACYIKLGDLDRAEIELNKAIQKDDKDNEYPPSYYNYGILLKAKGKRLRANNENQQADKILKKSISNFEEAIRILKEKSRNYGAIEAHNNIATTDKDTFLHTGKSFYLNRAIRRLEKLFHNEVGVDDAGLTRYNLACFYSLKGETEKAYNNLEKALKQDSSHVIDSKRDIDLHNLKWERASDYKELVKKHFGDYVKDIHLSARDLSEKRDKDGMRNLDSVKSAINMMEEGLIDVKIFNTETYQLLAYCYSLIGNKEKKEEYLELYDKQLHNEIR